MTSTAAKLVNLQDRRKKKPADPLKVAFLQSVVEQDLSDLERIYKESRTLDEALTIPEPGAA